MVCDALPGLAGFERSRVRVVLARSPTTCVIIGYRQDKEGGAGWQNENHTQHDQSLGRSKAH